MKSEHKREHIAENEDVVSALDDEIKAWKEESRFAIEACFNDNAKGFAELPPAFAAGTAFSFFKGLVENAFPASLGATMLKRAAMPIWLTAEAVRLYNDYYKEQAKDANKLLKQDYLLFKDAFVISVQKIERGFLNSGYGRDAAKQILRIVTSRRFEDPTGACDHIKKTIAKSKIINADPAALRKRTTGSLGALLKRVKAIYEGSVYGPGKTALYLVRWKDGVCGTDAERWGAQHPWVRGRGIKVDDIDIMAEKDKYSRELGQLGAKFKGKADCVLPIEMINNGNLGHYTGGKRAKQIIANIHKYDVVSNPTSVKIIGTTETYAWVDEQANSSIHDMAGTKMDKLNQTAITALVEAERKVWENSNY